MTGGVPDRNWCKCTSIPTQWQLWIGSFPINFVNDLREKDQIVDLVVVTRMAKTNAEKMKEWREKQRLKGHQASRKYYETHTEAVLERKRHERKEKKPADGTDEVGELVKKALFRYTLLQIVEIAHIML